LLHELRVAKAPHGAGRLRVFDAFDQLPGPALPRFRARAAALDCALVPEREPAASTR
jgi:hypothetical protein